MPHGHGGFHGGGHFGGRHGFGGWGGWGWPEAEYAYPAPCFYDAAGNCIPFPTQADVSGWFDDFKRVAEDAGTGGLAELARGHHHRAHHVTQHPGHVSEEHKVSGFRRGHVYERTPQLPHGPNPAVFRTFLERPGLTPVKIELRMGDLALACVVEVDGKLYGGAADLTQVWEEAKKYLAAYHEQLHRQGIPLVGCSIGAEDAATAIATDAVQKVGYELVSCCLAGWWSDLKKDFKSVEKDVSHYALHPSDIVRDAGKAIGLPKSVSNALSYATDPLQVVTENPLVQKAAAGYFGGPAGTAALSAAEQAEQGNLSLTSALKAATPVLQQFGAPSSVTDALTTAQQDIGQVQQYAQQAQQLPQQLMQQAQSAAQPFVQQAQGLVSQAQGAAQGFAQQAQGALTDATSAATSAASQAAQDATGALQGALSSATGDVSQLANQLPDLAQVSGQISPRELASKAAKENPSRVVGVVQLADSSWKVVGFGSPDQADDWFGGILGLGPDAFWYVAYYDKGDPTFPGPLNEQTSHAAPHVSGFLSTLALLAAGGAAVAYGPDLYHWGRGEWEKVHGKLATPAPHP